MSEKQRLIDLLIPARYYWQQQALIRLGEWALTNKLTETDASKIIEQLEMENGKGNYSASNV